MEIDAIPAWLLEVLALRLRNDGNADIGKRRADPQYWKPGGFLYQCCLPLVVVRVKSQFDADPDLPDESIHPFRPSAASGHGEHLRRHNNQFLSIRFPPALFKGRRWHGHKRLPQRIYECPVGFWGW